MKKIIILKYMYKFMENFRSQREHMNYFIKRENSLIFRKIGIYSPEIDSHRKMKLKIGFHFLCHAKFNYTIYNQIFFDRSFFRLFYLTEDEKFTTTLQNSFNSYCNSCNSIKRFCVMIKKN